MFLEISKTIQLCRPLFIPNFCRAFSTSNNLLIKRKNISKWKNKWPNETYFEADLEERCFDELIQFRDHNKVNRRRLFKLLLQDLIVNERVVTTVAKGKSLARLAEYLIELAKRNDEPQIYYMMQSKELVPRVFEDLLPRFKDMSGGYTSIFRVHSQALPVKYKGRLLHRHNGNSVVEFKGHSLPPLLPTDEELHKLTSDAMLRKKDEYDQCLRGTSF